MEKRILHVSQDLPLSGSLRELLIKFLSQLSFDLENNRFVAV